MARMSREFSLVLLGAGLLTAGYFLMPEPDPIKLANEDAEKGGSGGNSRGRARAGHVFFFYSSVGGSRPFASSAATTSTARGGFGRAGSTFSGG